MYSSDILTEVVMNKKDSFSQRAGDFLAGKGFYIVLLLCVAVIGASAWAMLSIGNTDKIQSDVAEVSDSSTGLADEIEVQASEDDWAVMGEDEMGEAPDIEIMDESDVYSDEEDAAAEQSPEASAPETESAPETTTDSSAETGEEAVAQEPAEQTVTLSDQYIWPVSGEVVVAHSVDTLIYDKTMGDWRTHAGIDISADLGEEVLAVNGGTVESIANDDLYGTTVTINHGDNLKSIYSNLASTPTVTEGQIVSAGEIIGAVGNTAIAESGIVTHVHLRMTAEDVEVDPLDYLP